MMKKGFTLIELTLSLSFVSVLLLMVTFLIIQMIAIYEKTMTVKAVNAVGREIIDDMSRHISASVMANTQYYCSGTGEAGSPVWLECANDNAFKYLYHQYYAGAGSFKVNGKDTTESLPTSGAFCTGTYTYIWNTGYVLNPNNNGSADYRASITYPDNGSSTTRNDFRLVRVFDMGGTVCRNNVESSLYRYKDNPRNISYNLSSSPHELVDSSESELAIYDMRLFHPGRHSYSGQAYYSGTFILATLQGDVDIKANGDFCKAPPSDFVTEFTYCAINKFNFASQATGEDIDD